MSEQTQETKLPKSSGVILEPVPETPSLKSGIVPVQIFLSSDLILFTDRNAALLYEQGLQEARGKA